jgi:hypothetical protein
VTPAALGQLLALVEARKLRDLAALDRLAAEDRRLAAEIAGLAAAAARDAAAAVALPLERQGARLVWADRQIRAARARRATLAIEMRAARAAAVQSLGKHRALGELEARARRAALQVREARAEREAPPVVGRER